MSTSTSPTASSSVRDIALSELMEIPGNVNVMSSTEFNLLCESLAKSGFCPALVVAPRNDKYVIIDGNHRFRAARLNNWATVPCHVLDIDDVTEQEILSARMNLVQGNVDRILFTRLWSKIRGSLDHTSAMRILGVSDERRLASLVIIPKRKMDTQIDLDDQVQAVMNRVPVVTDLIAVVRAALGDCNTSEFDHLVFQVHGSTVALVRCTPDQMAQVLKVFDEIKRRELPLAHSIMMALADTYRSLNE